LAQFKEGKIFFKAIAKHLKSSNPDIRRSTVECIEEVTANQTTNATLESTGSVVECLSDSNDLVRKTSVKWLCSVLALAKDSTASDLAKRTLADADPYSRYDAIEALLPFAIRGNASRACNAIDWYRSQDKDTSIRLKAERSLMVVAGCKKKNAVRCARAAIACANEAVSS
jgi:HEAT repeat protein